MKLISLMILVLFLLLMGCSGNDQGPHGWTSPQPIATYSGTSYILSPAINSNGDVLVNYVSGNTMYLNIYHQQTGWGRECKVGTNIFSGSLRLMMPVKGYLSIAKRPITSSLKRQFSTLRNRDGGAADDTFRRTVQY